MDQNSFPGFGIGSENDRILSAGGTNLVAKQAETGY